MNGFSDYDRIRSALSHIDATDRDDWVRMGMAVKAELGDEGFSIWDEWASNADNYSKRDSKDVWRSISPGGGVGVGTLFHKATEAGWKDAGHHHQRPSPEQIAERKRQQAERDRQEAQRVEADRKRTASLASAILGASEQATAENPYLVLKQVQPTETLRQIDAESASQILGYRPQCGDEVLAGTLLVVPIKQAGALSSVELIDGQKRKAALAGRGSKKEGYWATGRLPDGDGAGHRIGLAEGVATALSAFESTGMPVVAALSCGNLKPVAQILQKRHPKASIVLLADLDKATGEPDRHAVEAAQAVGGLLAVPVFGDDREPGQTDFNDLMVARGSETVVQCVTDAKRQGEVFPDPLPLPKLPPVDPFPLELLPNGLADYISDAADRARFPADFAAVSVMVALGSVIGRKLGIRLKERDDWTEYANVWGAVIGNPSALKSPSMREGLRPLKALQTAADNQHAKLIKDFQKIMDEHDLRKNAKRKEARKALSEDTDAKIDLGVGDEPPEPKPRTYWTSSVNDASLGVLLESNPNGLLIERDELSSMLVNLENEQCADLRGMMLSGWSGKEGYRFDRIIRGTTTLPKFALSVIGGIQPGPLARYVRSAFSGERADGLLQRFQLAVWPDSVSFEYVDRYPNSKAKKSANDLFEWADTFDPLTIGTVPDYGNEPPYINLSEEAQRIFTQWYTQFMQSRRSAETDGSESAPLAAHFGKYPGLVGKLAVVLHVADDPDAKRVSAKTMLKALSWIKYLTSHARRIYHAVEHPETGAAESLLARLKRGELPAEFKPHQITRKCWHGLSDSETVKKACRLLYEFGWLIEIEPGIPTGGVGRRPDPVYAISPAVEYSA